MNKTHLVLAAIIVAGVLVGVAYAGYSASHAAAAPAAG